LKEINLSTVLLVYNFADYIIALSSFDYGINSFTVIVVERAGPVKAYGDPGLAGALPPGSTTL
jgi:hypothetical protein